MTALEEYLAELGRGVQGIPARRRRAILREIEGNLLDEAEARGIQDERSMREFLAQKEAPELLAREFERGEGQQAAHRGGSALLAGALIGLATGGHLWVDHFRWYICLSFGVAHGFAVGAGFFWLRPRWQRLGPALRLIMAMAMATLLAIPLGFTTRHAFIPSRLLYGTYTGYLLERHNLPRKPWWLLLEGAVFTGLMFFAEMVVFHRIHHFRWRMLYGELSFNLTLGLGVLAALWLKRMLSERWLLTTQEQE
ncbi:MAG: hypothetical protein HY823_05075 [Acidobacteria bacterium]|nr:hypothetical protein [Acidobacteriota bacterium]